MKLTLKQKNALFTQKGTLRAEIIDNEVLQALAGYKVRASVVTGKGKHIKVRERRTCEILTALGIRYESGKGPRGGLSGAWLKVPKNRQIKTRIAILDFVKEHFLSRDKHMSECVAVLKNMLSGESEKKAWIISVGGENSWIPGVYYFFGSELTAKRFASSLTEYQMGCQIINEFGRAYQRKVGLSGFAGKWESGCNGIYDLYMLARDCKNAGVKSGTHSKYFPDFD